MQGSWSRRQTRSRCPALARFRATRPEGLPGFGAYLKGLPVRELNLFGVDHAFVVCAYDGDRLPNFERDALRLPVRGRAKFYVNGFACGEGHVKPEVVEGGDGSGGPRRGRR